MLILVDIEFDNFNEATNVGDIGFTGDVGFTEEKALLVIWVMLALLPVSVSTVANPPAWDRVVQDGQAESIEMIISTSRSVDIL